ncbi:hypothetical protein [Paraburkholderia sp. J10-1]|uniref:LPD3 domain-containing protein n=1 Tax=Paraburkholderia sp. J10-1 TaxID=2805430 RepID=UPI002AB5E1EB|nr:hypothetical protein [Paraburkholderia sp. J10-1]
MNVHVVAQIQGLRVLLDDSMGDAFAEAMLSGQVLSAVGDVEAAQDPVAEVAATEVLLALLMRLQAPQRAVILQNRDRGTPAMIAQMNAIAAAPDYFRVAPSREFASGAPIVFGNDDLWPSKLALGRKDKAVAANGQRFRIQYAVVEAADVITSNTADGVADSTYAAGVAGKLRAIAGNGRLAGLKAAFERGTADEYRRELAEDELTGIPAEAIERFDAPVLVRIMYAEDVTENIGDISNQRGTSDLSPVEQAQNDATRVNLADLDIADDGKPTETAALAFIAAMPESERNNLMDGKVPGAKAYERLMAAVFWKAYTDAELVRLYAQSVDAEVKTILGGMASAAADLARLDGAGALDIRGVVTEAASLAVNAKRQGVKLADFARQTDITLSPDVMEVVRMFVENVRSARKIGERLRDASRFAYEEFTKEDSDMFGTVEKATRAQVLEKLLTPVDTVVSLFDSVDPLRAIELSAELLAKTGALDAVGDDDPIGAVSLSEEIITIIRELEADAPPAAVPGVVVNGSDLGDFPDSPEGKVALRAAAKAAYELMLGQWVPCPALGGDVELRKQGMKKTLSMSGDVRKLKLIPMIKELITAGQRVGTQNAYDLPETMNVVRYHTMRSLVELNGQPLAVRFVVKEDDKGMFHYDHTVAKQDAIFDDAKANGPTEVDPSAAANYEPGASSGSIPGGLRSDPTRPSETPSGMLASVRNSKDVINPATDILDDAKANGPTEVDPITAANYKPGGRPAPILVAGSPTLLPGQEDAACATVLDSVTQGTEMINLWFEGEDSEIVVDDEAAPSAPELSQDDAQRAADLQYFATVVAGTVDMWDDDLADRLETMISRYSGDNEMEEAWRAAVNAYTDFMAREIGASAGIAST